MAALYSFFQQLYNRKKQKLSEVDLENMEDYYTSDKEEDKYIHKDALHTGDALTEEGSDSDEEEYEVVEREILPNKIICPDCGGITLEGLEFCDKCGGELKS